ncbi:MAG: TMEM175 family protein [Janthinobacterium lividum]
MLRTLLNHEHEEIDSDGFRLRGLGFSRLDGFSDVVFGFALTLLVVSLEVPKSFEELHHLWGAFLPFGVSFLLLMLIWYGHFTYFRRFGTHDAGTVWINGLLLFVVLFYVYPLKFLFLSAFGRAGSLGSQRDMTEVVLLFSVGLAALYFLFAALYANGYRQRVKLGLTPSECFLTRSFIVEEAGTGCIGLLVCVLSVALPPGYAGVSCLAFLLIGVWKSVMGARAGRRSRKMRAAELQTATATAHIPEANTASISSE